MGVISLLKPCRCKLSLTHLATRRPQGALDEGIGYGTLAVTIAGLNLQGYFCKANSENDARERPRSR